MSSFALKSDPSHLSLSWESTCQLLLDVKQPQTRQRALDLLLQAHADDIAAMCRSTAWARQWGFEDAYQEAVTHFFETALRTDDPAELTSYWNLRNAVRTGAAGNLYPISVTPHFAQKLQSYSFFRELEFVSTSHFSAPDFDEYGWQFLQGLCQPFLTKRQQSILTFLCQIPGEVPTILELADYLELSKASAQRAWNYFQQVFKVNPDLVQLLHRFVSFDFLQAYLPQVISPVPLSYGQSRTLQSSMEYCRCFSSSLSLLRRFALQLSQPLLRFKKSITSDCVLDFGLGFQAFYFRLSKGKISFQALEIRNLSGQVLRKLESITHCFIVQAEHCIKFVSTPFTFLDVLPPFLVGINKTPGEIYISHNCSNSLFLSLNWILFWNSSLIGLCRKISTPLKWARGSPDY